MIESFRQTGASEEELTALEQLEEAEAAKILARTFVELEQQGVLRMMLRRPKEDRAND
jgi:hypothetical protein